MKSKKQKCPVNLVGQREVTVLQDGRIKLPADVLDTLRSVSRASRTLYPGRIPLTKALILCPKLLWNRWKRDLQSQFPSLQTQPGAAAYLNPFKPVNWDRQGRIFLPAEANQFAAIPHSTAIILIGKEYYLELWSETEFNKAIAQCDAALQELDPLPEDKRSKEDTHTRAGGGRTP